MKNAAACGNLDLTELFILEVSRFYGGCGKSTSVSPKLFKGLLGCIGSLYVFAVATSASASTVELLDVQWNQGSVYAQVNLNGTDNPMTNMKPVDAPGTPKAHASLSAGSQSGTASASVTVSLKPSQELLASASTDLVGALATADAVVQLTYQIEILERLDWWI